MLPSEMPGAADGQWKMGSIPGPGGRNDTHSAADVEMARMRRALEEKEAELEGYRGKREPAADAEEAPLYRLNEPCYLGSSMSDWQVYPAGAVVEFFDHPNMSMVPLNDAARVRMAAYVEHLESCQREVFAASGAAHGGGLISDLHELLAHQQQQTRRIANEATRHPVAMPTELDPPHPSGQAHLAKPKRGRPKKVVREVSPPEDVTA